MITELRRLWQEAFGDTEEFLDCFFETAYSPKRCRFLKKDGKAAASLYWFDCGFGERKLAYIYAVATAKNHRSKGLCHRLMEDTHAELAKKGYSGAVLVPGSESLFRLYETMGYRRFGSVREFSCAAGTGTIPLQRICPEDYAKRRRVLLPKGSVLQEGESLRFLERQAEFFAGEDFLLAARAEKGVLFGLELLGNEESAPDILHALGCEKGVFRTPGEDRDFAMWLPFEENLPPPAYFGFAFD